jgi:hypothetical protein
MTSSREQITWRSVVIAPDHAFWPRVESIKMGSSVQPGNPCRRLDVMQPRQRGAICWMSRVPAPRTLGPSEPKDLGTLPVVWSSVTIVAISAALRVLQCACIWGTCGLAGRNVRSWRRLLYIRKTTATDKLLRCAVYNIVTYHSGLRELYYDDVDSHWIPDLFTMDIYNCNRLQLQRTL